MNKSRQLYALLAASVLASTATVQANLIFNGDFEDHDPLPNSHNGGQWGLFDSIPGWNSDDNDVLEIGTQIVYGVSGASGTVMELDPNRNVTATSTTAIGLGTYTLSFLYAKRDLTDDASNTFDVLWNNQILASFSPTLSTMTAYSVNVVGTLANNVLAFRGTGTVDSLGALIDDVSLVVVPEPSTYVAGGLALLPLLFGLRSRFAKK